MPGFNETGYLDQDNDDSKKGGISWINTLNVKSAIESTGLEKLDNLIKQENFKGIVRYLKDLRTRNRNLDGKEKTQELSENYFDRLIDLKNQEIDFEINKRSDLFPRLKWDKKRMDLLEERISRRMGYNI